MFFGRRKSKLEKVMLELATVDGIDKVSVSCQFNFDFGKAEYVAHAIWHDDPGNISLDTIISGDSPLDALENLRGMVKFKIKLLQGDRQ